MKILMNNLMRVSRSLFLAFIVVTAFLLFPVRADTQQQIGSIQPSQTVTCIVTGNGKMCEAMAAYVYLDTLEADHTVDNYGLVLRAYNYNTSWLSVPDFSVWMSFVSPNPGGIQTIQPQPSVQWCHTSSALQWGGISVALSLPCQIIDTPSTFGTTTVAAWHVYSVPPTDVLGFYSEVGLVVAVPEGQGWTFHFEYKDNSCRLLNGYGPCAYFDMSGTLTAPPGHVDPPPIGGGGGSCGGTHSCHT